MSHYDEEYWKYQKEIGQAGGVLNLFKFQDFIAPSLRILDFGCGGGFLLNNIDCQEKYGFEISDSARGHAESIGLKVFSSFDQIENDFFDLVISNHVFEHVPNPVETLVTLREKVKGGGKIVLVVPCEQPGSAGFAYEEDDINQHLYTWCPMTFGNLIKLAGFKVLSSDVLRHQWTPDYLTAYRSKPLSEYHAECVQHALKNNNYQVRVIAQKQ